MKFAIDRTSLMRPLNQLSSVVERRTTIPILSNIVLSAQAGQLSLTATDMEIDIVTTLNCAIATEGSCTCPAHLLNDIVRKMPEGAEINIEVAASQAQISAGRSNFKLPTLPVEDFPTFNAGEMPVQFTLTAADLRHQIDTTQFAISTEETRYYLNGIYFHKNDNGALAAVATDGHRLAMTIMDMPSGADQIPNIILPRKAVAEIRKMIGEDEGEVVVSLSEMRAAFSFGDVKLTSKLIDGSFPDYTRVIPKGNDKMVTVDTALFAAAVDRVSTISADKSKAVKVSLSQNLLTLSASTAEASSATEELEVDYSSDEMEIGFNARYLLDIAKQVESETMQIALSDPSSPSLISTPGDEANMFVLMPMRV
jgi:DNA polymerase-3 subunit beta